MVSLAQGNTLRKSAFWSMIFVKYLFYVAYARNFRGNLHVKSKDLNGTEIYLRFYFPKIFLAKQHLKEDFPQRFLAFRQLKKYPFKFRLNSDDPCAPWLIQSALRGLFRV